MPPSMRADGGRVMRLAARSSLPSSRPQRAEPEAEAVTQLQCSGGTAPPGFPRATTRAISAPRRPASIRGTCGSSAIGLSCTSRPVDPDETDVGPALGEGGRRDPDQARAVPGVQPDVVVLGPTLGAAERSGIRGVLATSIGGVGSPSAPDQVTGREGPTREPVIRRSGSASRSARTARETPKGRARAGLHDPAPGSEIAGLRCRGGASHRPSSPVRLAGGATQMEALDSTSRAGLRPREGPATSCAAENRTPRPGRGQTLAPGTVYHRRHKHLPRGGRSTTLAPVWCVS